MTSLYPSTSTPTPHSSNTIAVKTVAPATERSNALARCKIISLRNSHLYQSHNAAARDRLFRLIKAPAPNCQFVVFLWMRVYFSKERDIERANSHRAPRSRIYTSTYRLLINMQIAKAPDSAPEFALVSLAVAAWRQLSLCEACSVSRQ